MQSVFRSLKLHWLALAVLLLIAAYLRFSHADWDGGNQLHPDERAILFVASDLHTPETVTQALDAQQSPLNPFRNPDGSSRPYPYGHIPLYLTVVTGHVLRLPCSSLISCDSLTPDSFLERLLNPTNAPPYVHYTYVGRALSALYDCLTIVFTFLIARRLFNPHAALMAATMHTFAVIHIQNAHFGTVDTALTLFSTLTIYCLIVYSQSDTPLFSILAGICVGLAFGSKASAIYLALPIVYAHLQVRPSIKLIRMEVFWLTTFVALITFAITNPYAILDFIPFVTSVVTQAQVTSGTVDFPFTRQYSGTPPIIYHSYQLAKAFLGVPLAVTIYLGIIASIGTQFRKRSRPQIIVILWIAVIFLTAGVQYVKFPRYLLPALPAIFALSSGMLATSRLQQWQRYAFATLIILPTAFYAAAFMQMYRSQHPWVAASEWIYTELPPQTRIISELWDDPLPLDLVIDGQGYLREMHVDSVLIHPFDEPDDLEKLHSITHEVAAADFIILSSNRLYGVIPRLGDRYPLSSAYYEALFAEEIGYELDRTFYRYPKLFGVSLIENPLIWPSLSDPDMNWPEPAIHLSHIDESFTIYDHPLVLVFRNEDRLSQSEIEARIVARSIRPTP